MSTRAKLLLLIHLLAFATNTTAAPVLLYDSGTAHSIAPYLESARLKAPSSINIQKDIMRQLPSVLRQATTKTTQPFIAQLFPVSSPSLSPGKVITRNIITQGMISPICIIGADNMSMTWLLKNKTALANANATCLVVNVKTYAQYQTVLRIAPKIRFQPARGDNVAKAVGLNHYPALISAQYIEQ
jgi:integrating conjugative element protein (TIGR03765 family)